MIKILLLFLSSFIIYTNALSNIDSLLAELEGKSDSIRILHIVDYSYENTSKDPINNLRLLMSVSDEAARLSNSAFKARYFFNIAFAYDYVDSLNQALHYYYSSIDILEKADADVGIDLCFNNIGVIYKKQFNFIAALKAYREAYEFTSKKGNKASMISSAINISNIYYALEDYDNMLETMFKAEELALNFKESKYLGLIYSNIGNVYFHKGDVQNSIKYINMGWEHIKKSRDIAHQASNRNVLAKNYIKMNRPDLAKPLLDQADSLAEITGSGIYKNQVVFNRGYFHRMLKEYERSIDYYKQGLEWSVKAKDIPRTKSGYFEISQNYKDIGKFDSAYKYLNLLYRLNDSLNKQMVIDEIARASLKLEGAFNSELVGIYREEVRNKEIENLITQKYLNEITGYLYWIIALAFVLMIMTIYAVNNLFRLKKANRNLSDSELKLKELNDTKDKFFSIIAHDLKGPVSGIQNLLVFMNDNRQDFTEEERNELINDLAESSRELMNLLENLLTWSMTQLDKLQVDMNQINPHKTINSAIKLLQNNSNVKSISIENHIPNELEIYNDENLLYMIIRNTLNNAIKFTNNGGKIKIYHKVENSKLEITVEDNGIGIEPNLLNELFDVGIKKRSLGTNGERGTGLGLIISKEYAKKMGGDIRIESQLEMGTKVHLTLPI